MKHLVRSVICSLAVFSFSLPVFAAGTDASSAPQSVQPAEAVKTSGPAVNINTADAAAITGAHIKGIGKKRAEAIVAYRQQHGPFKSVDDLNLWHNVETQTFASLCSRG
jgi:competence protein ComEA